MRTPLILTAFAAVASQAFGEVVYQQNTDYASGALGASPTSFFFSRPDLTPVAFNVQVNSSNAVAPGSIFLSPRGSSVKQGSIMILDTNFSPIWINTFFGGATDVRKQIYKGKPVLTFWLGTLSNIGFGNGYGVIMDTSYNVIKTINVPNMPVGFAGTDAHELLIVNDNAIVTKYTSVPCNLTAFGIQNAHCQDSNFIEINVETNTVVFQWSSLQAGVMPSESYIAAYDYMDYFHINSVDKDSNGDYIVSGRHVHALYKVSGKDGSVIWKMNGKKSDFAMGDGTPFFWQHSVVWISTGSQLTVFDNGASQAVISEATTRGLLLNVDETARTVTLARKADLPVFGTTTPSQGNLQTLANGNHFLGYGQLPYFAEFDINGDVVSAVQFGNGNISFADVESYRVFKDEWSAYPQSLPSVTYFASNSTAYVSWNGATDVKSWQLLGGAESNSLSVLLDAPKSGFETILSTGSALPAVLLVRAISINGSALADSPLFNSSSNSQYISQKSQIDGLAPSTQPPIGANLQTYIYSDNNWTYTSCWGEPYNGEPRALPTRLDTHGQTTVEACLAAASVAGYGFAGLEYGGECWAGNSAPQGGQIPESYCDTLCANDGNSLLFSQKCGGSYVLSLYTRTKGDSSALTDLKGYTSNNVQWAFSSCFGEPSQDGSQRALPNRIITSGATPQTCMDAATALGFGHAGLEYGGECWAGSSNPAGGVIDQSYCNKPCSSASGYRCGGDYVLSLYNSGVQSLKSVKTSNGFVYTYSTCWGEPQPVANGRALYQPIDNNVGGTVETCLELASRQGFTTVGLEYGGECWASYGTIYGGAIPESYCNIPCKKNNLERCGGSLTLSIYLKQ